MCDPAVQRTAGLFDMMRTMTGREIIAEVKKLGLPSGSFVVFGSCPLAVAGIREANDVDLLVSPEVLESLKKAGWKQVNKGKDDKPYTYGVFEAHSSWNFASYQPTLKQLLKTADIVDGVPFASLQEVRAWKESSGRPKDLVDIAKLDAFLQGRSDLSK